VTEGEISAPSVGIMHVRNAVRIQHESVVFI